MIDETIIKLALLCFSAKDHEDVVKLEGCGLTAMADLIEKPDAKYMRFFC